MKFSRQSCGIFSPDIIAQTGNCVNCLRILWIAGLSVWFSRLRNTVHTQPDPDCTDESCSTVTKHTLGPMLTRRVRPTWITSNITLCLALTIK